MAEVVKRISKGLFVFSDAEVAASVFGHVVSKYKDGFNLAKVVAAIREAVGDKMYTSLVSGSNSLADMMTSVKFDDIHFMKYSDRYATIKIDLNTDRAVIDETTLNDFVYEVIDVLGDLLADYDDLHNRLFKDKLENCHMVIDVQNGYVNRVRIFKEETDE